MSVTKSDVEQQSISSIEPGTLNTDIVLASDLNLDVDHKNAGGAAVEDKSPIGMDVGWWTAVLLNFSQMIGTGIFSTPGTILKQTGSFGLAIMLWVLGGITAWAGLAWYTELAAVFPNRAGSDIAYLEQSYKKPKFLFPIAFAVVTVLLGVAAGNSIVCAQYLLFANGQDEYDPWVMRGLAIAVYAVVIIIAVVNNRAAMWISNVLAGFKIFILLFIVVTGWAVLGGGTRVQDPHSHFKDAFKGSSSNGNALAGAIINVMFAYNGWNNANNVTNEMKNPIKTLKTAGPTSLGIVFLLYIFANIAYVAAVPMEEAQKSGQLLAAKFFAAVFGDYAGRRVLPVFVALSSFGSLVASAIGQGRVYREVARQGLFPYSRFFTSTKPFGTPAAPLLFKFVLTSIVIIGPPPGDAFNLIVAIQSYPNRLFDLLLVIGVFIIRRRRARAGAPAPEYRAWNIALYVSILMSVFILIMPWVPPAKGAEPFSFPYWVPWVTGIGVLFLCFVYWFIWTYILPKAYGYKIYEQVVQLSNGELSKTFIKVYNDQRGDAFRRRIAEERERDEANEPRAA